MTSAIKWVFIAGILFAYWALVPTVTSLPSVTAEGYLQTASNFIAYFCSTFPWFDMIWGYIILVFQVELALWSWHWFRLFLHWL